MVSFPSYSQTYFRELLRMLVARFYAHVLLQDDAMDMLFCHRWLLLSFKREFFNEEVLKMWEACWSHYQTEYFHIFLCVAMVQEYGSVVVEQNMSADDMLQFFTDLSMKMDGTKVLRTARQLLLKFRQLPGIPCSLRGLLSGPGIWDSAPLPEIQCSCHNTCVYLHGESKGQSLDTISEKELSAEKKGRAKLVCDNGKASSHLQDHHQIHEAPHDVTTCQSFSQITGVEFADDNNDKDHNNVLMERNNKDICSDAEFANKDQQEQQSAKDEKQKANDS